MLGMGAFQIFASKAMVGEDTDHGGRNRNSTLAISRFVRCIPSFFIARTGALWSSSLCHSLVLYTYVNL